MARKMTMNLLSLYNYDESLFDNLVLPEGIDKDTLVNNLLLDTVSQEVLYADPDIMKQAIGMWSKKELPVWQRLKDTLDIRGTYNPIYNYDRNEEITNDHTKNTTESENHNLNKGTDTTKVSQGSFNSNDLTQVNQQDNILGSGNDENGRDTFTGDHTFNAHLYGNIGVTTTQEMIREELSIDEINILDYIIDSFKNRFILSVYNI